MGNLSFKQAADLMDEVLVDKGNYYDNLTMIQNFVKNISGKVYDNFGNESSATRILYTGNDLEGNPWHKSVSNMADIENYAIANQSEVGKWLSFENEEFIDKVKELLK